jgi:type III secretion protein HrpB1
VTTFLPVRRDLIQALISILSQGIQDNQLDNSEKLLNAIRVLSPDLQGLDEFASYIAIKRGFVREALQTYSGAPTESSKWYVMMALCLRLTGDPTWHWHAMQSLERDDASSKYAHNLARILLGKEEVADSNVVPEPAASPASSTSSQGGEFLNYLAV